MMEMKDLEMPRVITPAVLLSNLYEPHTISTYQFDDVDNEGLAIDWDGKDAELNELMSDEIRFSIALQERVISNKMPSVMKRLRKFHHELVTLTS